MKKVAIQTRMRTKVTMVTGAGNPRLRCSSPAVGEALPRSGEPRRSEAGRSALSIASFLTVAHFVIVALYHDDQGQQAMSYGANPLFIVFLVAGESLTRNTPQERHTLATPGYLQRGACLPLTVADVGCFLHFKSSVLRPQ